MDECGNYVIEDLGRLGRGGFGEVYKVNVYNRQKSHMKEYARKYFSPTPENNNTAIREIANLRERFLIEIKTQYKLNGIGHHFIAPIVLFNMNGERPFFIMELAEGNLLNIISKGMSVEDKSKSVINILNGLKLIHDNKYIHRDLKPENILRYSDGRYKISDFGLVKDLDTVRAEVKTRFKPNGIGTDGYRAPEISDNGTFSVQSDIYAVGKIISDIYEGNAPAQVRTLITRCMNFFPEDRYSTVDELLESFYIAMKVNTETA